MDNLMNVSELRRLLKRELPDDTFSRKPSGMLLMMLFNTIVGFCFYAVYNFDLQWYSLVLISMILGTLYLSLTLLAHDFLHGAVVKNKKVAMFFSYFGFYGYLLSPHLWDVWHNRLHHGYTNTPRDPDAALLHTECENNPLAKKAIKMMPSSNNAFTSILFYGYWFTFIIQIILHFNKKFVDWDFDGAGLNKTRALIETFFYYAFWITIGITAGLYNSLFLILIPMIIANVIFMSYAASEHTYMPAPKDNHPLENTASVIVPKMFDSIFLNFSNHIEHHLFPSMSFRNTHRVRKWLKENMSEYYTEPTAMDSYRIAFSTPRMALNENELVQSMDSDAPSVDRRWIREQLRNGKYVSQSKLGATHG